MKRVNVLLDNFFSSSKRKQRTIPIKRCDDNRILNSANQALNNRMKFILKEQKQLMLVCGNSADAGVCVQKCVCDSDLTKIQFGRTSTVL